MGIIASQDALKETANGELKESLQTLYDDLVSRGLIRETDAGVVVAESAAREIAGAVEAELEENPDVLWLPVVSSDDLPADWFQSLTVYNNYRGLVDDTALNYFFLSMSYGSRVWARADVSDYFLVAGRTDNGSFPSALSDRISMWSSSWGSSTLDGGIFDGLRFLSRDGLEKNVYSDSVIGFNNGDILTPSGMPLAVSARLIYPFKVISGFYGQTAYMDSGFLVRGCNTDAPSYIPVFRDHEAYMDWITGNGSYYRFESGYQGGDITVNPGADYSAVIKELQDIMRQSVASGDNVSAMLGKMQEAYGKKLDEISGTLGDIGDNTAATNTWLEKIYGLLERQEKELDEYFENARAQLDALKEGAAESNRLLGSLIDTFDRFTDNVSSFFKEAAGYMGSVPQEIRDAAGDLKQAVSDTGADIVSAIRDARDAIVGAVRGVDINIDGSVDETPDENGDTVWTKLGRGLAKILTAVLNLLKVLIFRALDALGYFAGILTDNIDAVFDGIDAYFDRALAFLPGRGSLLPALAASVPQGLRDIMVLAVFALMVSAVIVHLRR